MKRYHIGCAFYWLPEPPERVLIEKAAVLVGGRDAVLIVDATALLKQGRCSVGVARQYAGAARKTTHCQTLVSLTLVATHPELVRLRNAPAKSSNTFGVLTR